MVLTCVKPSSTNTNIASNVRDRDPSVTTWRALLLTHYIDSYAGLRSDESHAIKETYKIFTIELTRT